MAQAGSMSIAHKSIPSPVYEVVQWLSFDHAMEEEGLFRQAGSKIERRQLEACLDENPNASIETIQKAREAEQKRRFSRHTVANVIVSYFTEATELEKAESSSFLGKPFRRRSHDPVLHEIDSEDPDEWMTAAVIAATRAAVESTDETSQATLKYLCEFLSLVSSSKYIMSNKMSYLQCANCVFAPFGFSKLGQVMIRKYDEVFTNKRASPG